MPPDRGEDEDLDLAAPAAAKKGKAATAKAATRPKKKVPVGLLAAILGAVLLLGGGWYFWSQSGGEAANPAAGQDLLNRASAHAKAGRYDQAIMILQDIKPDDPQHDRALEMIAELQQKKAQAAQMIDGRPAATFYQEQLAAARTAFEAHDYVLAKRTWEQAMRVQPLPPDAKANYDVASQQVSKLDGAKALFAERRFADALASLQPLMASDPENQNIRRMIIDAQFNLGAMALQEERTADAMKSFEEVLKVSPDDELAQRSRALAERYHDQPKDLLYRIYVKYLPLRQAT
jgi:tetratricopeptide (TPR) repeat protein